MKNRLLHILVVCLLMLVVACQDQAEQLPPVHTDEITVSFQVMNEKNASSRGAEDESAVGKVPYLRGTVLFLLTESDGKIADVSVADANTVLYPSGTGVTLKFDRMRIKTIHVIGNVDIHPLRLNGTFLPASTDWEKELVNQQIGDIQYVMANQGKPLPANEQEKIDPYAVNVRGRVETLSLPQSSGHAIIPLRAAISRVEIGGLKGIADNDPATYDLETFTLLNIYIDNTFNYMGADYTSYPAAADRIGYDWNYSGFKYPLAASGAVKPSPSVAYPFRLCLNQSENLSGYVSNSTSKVLTPRYYPYWSFYVLPAHKENSAWNWDNAQTPPLHTLEDVDDETRFYPYLGNVLAPFVGDTSEPVATDRKQYSAMPIIICKLTDVKLNDNKSSYPEWYDEINNLGWLTVTKFYDQKKYNEAQKITDPIDQEKAVKNARILFMLPGYVYKIEEITFTASDIHSQPITEDEAGLYVLVKVMDWSEVEVIGNPMPL